MLAQMQKHVLIIAYYSNKIKSNPLQWVQLFEKVTFWGGTQSL